MMKRVGYLTEKIADLDNLLEAFRKACCGKQRKKEVLEYRADLDNNISFLRRQILMGNVEVGRYQYFTIYDPKERVICAADFGERVLHHAIINVCQEYFDRRLIDTTYATRKGKGVYAAIEKAVEACTRYKYTVKLDVRKYYDSIDHGILKELLRRYYKDVNLLHIFDSIIESYSVAEGKGLPIGNLTSQYFANAYLSPFDHYAKEVLQAPIYIRYMDDIFIAGNNKDRLRFIVAELKGFATEKLYLTIKPPIFRNSQNGQVFLGYKVQPYRYELSGRSKRRYRTKMTRYDRNLNTGVWDEQKYQEHIQPLTAFVKHAVSRNFRRSCLHNTIG